MRYVGWLLLFVSSPALAYFGYQSIHLRFFTARVAPHVPSKTDNAILKSMDAAAEAVTNANQALDVFAQSIMDGFALAALAGVVLALLILKWTMR
jgi:hypothetical protein